MFGVSDGFDIVIGCLLYTSQNEKQQALQQRELEWLAGQIKMFTEKEQEAILASALSFAEHDLIVATSISIPVSYTHLDVYKRQGIRIGSD